MRLRYVAAMGLLLMSLLLVAAECPNGNARPVAVFVPDPTSGASPLTVDFDASASYDPDGTVVDYSWDFGDGATGTGMTTSHTFATTTDKTYTVRLTVTDDGGKSATTSVGISVTGSEGVGTAILISDGDPSSPQNARFALEYQGGQILLSGSPDGTGEILADMGFVIWVDHADGSEAERQFDFYCGMGGRCPKSPQDVTDLFEYGVNDVTVNTYYPNSSERYLGEGEFRSPMWLVVKPIPSY